MLLRLVSAFCYTLQERREAAAPSLKRKPVAALEVKGSKRAHSVKASVKVRPHVNKPGERLLAVGCWRENQDNHHVRCAKLECKILLVKITVT